MSSAPTSPSALGPWGFTVRGTNKDVFGALEPPEALEEAAAAAGTRARAPGTRKAEQPAARCPAGRPAASRAHHRAQRGNDIEAAGPAGAGTSPGTRRRTVTLTTGAGKPEDPERAGRAGQGNA